MVAHYAKVEGRVVRGGLLLIGFALAAFIQGAGILKFGDFQANEVFSGQSHAPILSTPLQRKFRSQIRVQAGPPPDFAGAFKIAHWGCGSSCVSIVVINLKTGMVYDGPFVILGYGPSLRYEGGDDELEYRASSRLLVVRGCPEDRNCGTYYYDWKGDHFERLRFAPAGTAR